MKPLVTALTLLLAICSAAHAQSRQEISYGPDPMQNLDVYLPPNPEAAPILVMLHGGAWRIGDKRNRDVWQSKVTHWLPQGYVFISVNTRLLPDADPVMQAQDLAMALGFIQQNADRINADADRIVLMGHSAGAHVAALLATRDDIKAAAGLAPWRGTVLLDTAALDVADMMQDEPAPLYRRAFGSDDAFWRTASPAAHLDRGDGPFLIVCSSQRYTPCAAAQTFQRDARQDAVAVVVLPQNLSHGQVNAQLGQPSAYTQAVSGWMNTVLD
ncbi:alpha/beta hydrolase family protein [Yoonia maricola]|uniref:Alpha/beta hydrolase family protein n=1 Tax=Yoonia maricola TaxID=420999 RepID=A0A2M8WKF6_9RHOB|nr:alpha/beta hydrolase [Yoonia maricola]PJI91366.1 alpha/beta hydrolase family protein [Yoonia maricola]